MQSVTTPRRTLSGVQPSGKLHLGNYFGAIRQYLDLQHQSECFFFLADYHSMTTITDAALRRQLTHEAALDYLALGLDPKKAVLFRQSDVPEVCELTWIFSTVCPMGLLERAVSYKEKVEKGIEANAGLFTYPVLMAADILIYRAHVVPVGRDQVQHLEMTRDIAERFNRIYGEIFPLPDYRLTPTARVPGVDGQKMSKSYNNTIEIFAEGKPLKKTVMGIVTDSKTVEEPKDPDNCNLFTLYSLFASEEQKAEMAQRYRAGNLGYGTVKSELLALIEAHFAAARQRRKELVAQPDLVEDVLQAGAKKAREEARKTLDLVRKATGFA